MHELSIAQSIIAIVEKSLPEDFTGVVENIGLQVGELSGIEVDALSFSFSILKEKSKIPHSNLTIEKIVAKALCKSCGAEFFLKSFGESCLQCNSLQYSIVQGKELKVLKITVSD